MAKWDGRKYDDRIPAEKPSHWPAEVEVDTQVWVSWLPEKWGQAIKETSGGKKATCYISPEGKMFYKKSEIEQLLGKKLGETMKGHALLEWVKKRKVQKQGGNTQESESDTSSSYSGSDEYSDSESDAAASGIPKAAPPVASAKASPQLVPPMRGKACAKMMVRAAYRCRCHFARQCPAGTNGALRVRAY